MRFIYYLLGRTRKDNCRVNLRLIENRRNIMRIAGLIAGIFFTGCAMAGEFDHPWDDPTTALLIDPYYANSIDWDKLATEPRGALWTDG
jgi:hypothetical protein